MVSDGSSSGGGRSLTSLPAKCNANLGSRSPSAAQAAGETAAISNVWKTILCHVIFHRFFLHVFKIRKEKKSILGGVKKRNCEKNAFHHSISHDQGVGPTLMVRKH